MRRGYSREAYLELLQRVRDIIPGVSVSTDIITGFCGETEADHSDTMSLMASAQFDQVCPVVRPAGKRCVRARRCHPTTRACVAHTLNRVLNPAR